MYLVRQFHGGDSCQITVKNTVRYTSVRITTQSAISLSLTACFSLNACIMRWVTVCHMMRKKI